MMPMSEGYQSHERCAGAASCLLATTLNTVAAVVSLRYNSDPSYPIRQRTYSNGGVGSSSVTLT